MHIKQIHSLDEKLLTQIVSLWEKAVRTSHHFLSMDEINHIKHYVPEAVCSVEKLYVACEEDKIVGFMGTNQEKLEMLFVYPTGKGIGSQLMNQVNIHYVDVNEQNELAYQFYRKKGFDVYERSELDEQGNPYPILKMKR